HIDTTIIYALIFFFHATSTSALYTLSLHDALPIFAKDLFQAVAFFIAFGLLMTLSWMRLEAPDVALAEAAIGTGLTGALFLDARSEEHTSELQSRENLVCRLLLEKKKEKKKKECLI